MKIELWSIGKKNESIFADAIAEFNKRIQRYYKCELITISSKAHAKASIVETKLAEAQQIEALLQEHDFLICLDENGAQLTTVELAAQFEKWLLSGAKRIIFLIGGAYGIHPQLLAKAKFQLGLGKLTFPHQLVRLIITEQLYRVCTVLNNENYHHQ
jgi:23S rRNA (pseudouridine1915-N3)-methyltransferase